jgi:hypothetical protein
MASVTKLSPSRRQGKPGIAPFRLFLMGECQRSRKRVDDILVYRTCLQTHDDHVLAEPLNTAKRERERKRDVVQSHTPRLQPVAFDGEKKRDIVSKTIRSPQRAENKRLVFRKTCSLPDQRRWGDG